MKLVHINVATAGRTPLAPEPGQLEALVRSLARRDRLLFGIADEHLHVVDWTSQPALRGRDLSVSRLAMERAGGSW